jgi:hypothetical protein
MEISCVDVSAQIKMILCLEGSYVRVGREGMSDAGSLRAVRSGRYKDYAVEAQSRRRGRLVMRGTNDG